MRHTIKIKSRALIDGAEYDITDQKQCVPVQNNDIIEIFVLTGDLTRLMVTPGEVVRCVGCPIRPCVVTDNDDHDCVFISDEAIRFVNIDSELESI